MRELSQGSVLSPQSYLGGKHVLGVAVVVAVALEALAHAGGGVAGATVKALGDVLVGGAADGLGDLVRLVAHAIEDPVEGLGEAGGDAGVVERVAVLAALGDGEGGGGRGVGGLGGEDLVDICVALDHKALTDGGRNGAGGGDGRGGDLGDPM